ncbi:FAD dependent oxidoreductase [Lentzea albidocapillata subsp. violacea]|uniref:FAD dependent oxidoreductase n=2 Tax=Lentzea albidocapillata TaxID=40571 RepID=A0A1G8V4B6_9PSEU|nr:FAD dependent oxidoreductase [Lentzea albidocapillata subsp. violacea]
MAAMYSDRALVIGAGFAGLLAARVLSESYGDVVLVERDTITADSGHRAGIPQACHPHPLPARGAQALEALFPRLGRELENAGAVRADLGSDFLNHFPAGPAPRDHLGLSVLSVTRVTLDRIIRRRVLRLANVSLVDGVTIEGLLHDRGTVTGVHGRRGDRPFTDYADLVVDTSGRDSKLVSWLAELGVHCPAPRIVNGHLTCASRLYEVNRDLDLGWKNACESTHAPGTRRGGAVSSVDGSRWLVTLFGADGDTAPADDDGFLDHATSLRCQDVAEIVKTATPASAIHRAGHLRNRWNRFHQVPDWPRGLLALGDSVVSLDPVHGHGLTVTALNCADLRTLLRDHDLAGEPLMFQRAVARAARFPWTFATTADLGWSMRKLPLSARLLRWYSGRVIAAIPGNRQVYRAYVRVTQLAGHPVTLLRPAVLFRVLAGKTLSGRRPRATAP